MVKAFKLQDPGEGIHEAEIKEVHVFAGDPVQDGDTLMSIETDKAVTDIPAPFTGTIKEIKVKEGDTVQVGDVLVTYLEKGTAEVEEKAEKETEIQERESPEKQSARQKAAKTKDTEEEIQSAPASPVPASPATRRLARELGVNLREVTPSGPEGRVTSADVRAFGEGKKPAVAEGEEATVAAKEPRQLPRAAVGEAPPLLDFTRWGPVDRQPLRSVRRSTAKQMALAWAQIPHVMHKDVADITELEKFRRQHKRDVENQGGKLTLTVLVIKAVIAALRHFPRFNASVDMENQEIIIKHYYHLGVAVATEQGLLVPVIRDAERKSLTELAIEFTTLAEKTRQGKVTREEMQGGTFTITNPGPIGGITFTPIINYPEAAILGLGKVQLEPVAQGDIDHYEIVARLRLPLCLVYDHRVNDGATAAYFLRNIIDTLHDPESYLLSV